jgi:pimeloyl-ACP methyl ester carboxylesterase
MSIRNKSISATAVAALLLVLAGCAPTRSAPGDPSADGLAPFREQDLRFGACDPPMQGPDVAAPQVKASQCATLEVPLDYAHPDEKAIDIAVLRVPATGKDRIGSVVINPGGPGAPATSFAPILAAVWAESPVVERFDIVGFDPRGVGLSRPSIDCYSDRQRDDDARLSAIAGYGTAWTKKSATDVARQCAAGSGGTKMISHIGTRDSARDLDVLRSALGDKKLSFVGTSYGTRLGAVYAEMFPDKVRALVLDGAVDPTKGTRDRYLQQAAGLQRSFEQVAAFCATQVGCPLGSDPAHASTQAQKLLRPLIDNPIHAADGRTVTFLQASEGIVAGLYSEAQWPRIVTGLTELRDGRADELLALRDEYHGRTASGAYPGMFEATFAINCMDEQRLTPAEANVTVTEGEAAAPFTDPGVSLETINGCAGWPSKPTLGFPYATDIRGLPQTLVLSVTGDPVTPHEGGVALARVLDARLLTVEGEQHGTTLSRNSCIDGAVAAYLIDLKLPKDGARCTL